MPQFDLTTYPSQIFWLILCFGTLIAILKWLIIPYFNAIHLKRDERIRNDLATSEKLQSELIKKQEQRLQKLEQAKAQASDLIHKTVTELEQFEAEQLQELQGRIKKQLQDFQHLLYEESQALEGQIELLVNQSLHQLLPKFLGEGIIEKR
jgi:F-type H+-transporting ATPase subunit b